MIGNPDRNFRRDKLDMETLCEGNSITATEPRPKKIDVVLRVVAFVGFLGVVFLFFAFNVPRI